MKDTLKIRAHHLLCIPRFFDASYTKEFGRHWKRICFSIRQNPEIKIKVVKERDILCYKCPHFDGKACNKRPGINRLILEQDKAVLKELGIKEGSVHNAREVFNLSIEKTRNAKLKKICRGCDFLHSCIEFGINKSFKKSITKNAGPQSKKKQA